MNKSKDYKKGYCSLCNKLIYDWDSMEEVEITGIHLIPYASGRELTSEGIQVCPSCLRNHPELIIQKLKYLYNLEVKKDETH